MAKTFPFAQRTHWSLENNQFSKDLKRLKEAKTELTDLSLSNPTQCQFTYFNESLCLPLASTDNLSYEPNSRGNMQARKAVCAYYLKQGIKVEADQIFLTASTSEAYSNLFRLLADVGDQVLFPRPSYPLFAFLGDLNDVNMQTYPLEYTDQWHVDLSVLQQSFNEQTKACVIVNPNNPTGSFIKTDELKSINEFCQKYNSAIISDEVFSDFTFNHSEDRISLAKNKDVLTFVLGSLSKTLGLPQMKLSWIIVNGPKDIVRDACARLEIITDTFLSVNTPTQNALADWLSKRESIQKEINERIGSNLKYLKSITDNNEDVSLLNVQGGWYVILKIPNSKSEEEWILSFLNNDHVIVHPGYFFDFEDETHIILSLLPIYKVFQMGIKRILARISIEAQSKQANGQTC